MYYCLITTNIMNKKKIIDILNSIYKTNIININNGNISYYVSGFPYYFITPSFLDKNNINDTDILKIPLTENIKDDYINKSSNNYKLLYYCDTDLFLHDSIIKHHILTNPSEDIAVIHNYPINTMYFMGLYRNINKLNIIENIFPEIKKQLFLGDIPYDIMSKSYNERINSLSINIQNSDIIGNHHIGIISKSFNISDAFHKMTTLEYYCEIYNNSINSVIK